MHHRGVFRMSFMGCGTGVWLICVYGHDASCRLSLGLVEISVWPL